VVLISIIGDFHSSVFPIFYEFKELVSKHIVVHDDAFNEKFKNRETINTLNNFTKKYNLPIQTEEYNLDEDSFASIMSLVDYIKSTVNNLENLYINTTDGLANIGLLLASNLLKDGVKLISYDMYENSYNLTSNASIQTKKLDKKMSIKDHFFLKSLEVVAYEDKEFAHQYAHHIKELFQNYYDQFIFLKQDVSRNSFINNNKYPQAMQLINLMGLDIHIQKKEITGGLFELYTYLLIKDLGFDDIEIGVVIEDKFSQNTAIKNEFDLLLMKDNHLHMIECKFQKVTDMQALVYKYSSLINLIDDDGRMIILTDRQPYSHNLYDHTTMGLENYRRALANKILIRGSIFKNREKFIDDVKTHFNLY
jgi:hypothetical protein